MAKFNVHQCPVCDHNIFSAYISCKDYLVSGEVFHIKKCNNCGFAITGNIDDEEGIGYYYQSENYISHSNASEGLMNKVYHLVRNHMLVKKRKLIGKITGIKHGRILDIGTGTGYFLNEMKRKGWQVTGTEKSEQAREFASKEFDFKLLDTNELYNLEPGSFDAITLWHVLEHVHQLKENMEAFKKLLKPDGKLVVALPNHSAFDAKYYEEYWAAWDVPRHIWHFLPENIKIFGEKFGFRLIEMKPMHFDAFYVSLLSEKYKKSKFGVWEGINTGLKSWMKSWVKPEKCSSVIYIFDKN